MKEELYLWKDECYEIIGCCMEVHSNLGCGFLEAIYQEALMMEFFNQHLPFESEKELAVNYKGTILNKKYKVDFFCYNEIIVELKAVSSILPIHYTQLFNYLKASQKPLGLLINFGSKSLEYKRIIL